MNTGVWWLAALLAGLVLLAARQFHTEARSAETCRCGLFTDTDVHITADRVHTPRACPTHGGVAVRGGWSDGL